MHKSLWGDSRLGCPPERSEARGASGLPALAPNPLWLLCFAQLPEALTAIR